MNPAAQSLQQSFIADGTPLSDLEAEFAEAVVFYQGFHDAARLRLLPYEPDDIRVVVAKMNAARAEGDYKTSDFLRVALRSCGLEKLARNR